MSESENLFRRGCEVLPGGVNSPVRAFKSVGGTPPFLASGGGSHVTDEDGNTYLDYVMSYGPLLFGHAPNFVAEAMHAAVDAGTVFGAPTRAEVKIAELVTDMVPSIEMVRFVNSGTEAVASALRLARGATGRRKIVKCAGCFHGSVDAMLVQAGSGVATLGIPETAGVPKSVAADTLVVDYNDSAALEEVFRQYGHEIAAFILEPVAANMGVVPPLPGYLQTARRVTAEAGALLIFDEVITGFRLAPGGAQELYGVLPDLTCLGKILGGGVPCAAYGGSRKLMENLAPVGPVYQAGTLSGNPLAMNAGTAMLSQIGLTSDSLYQDLEKKTEWLAAEITAEFAKANTPCCVQQVGSILTVFFAERKAVTNYTEARDCDTQRFARFFHGLLRRGIYVAPSQYEAWFLSTQHKQSDLEKTITAIRGALAD